MYIVTGGAGFIGSNIVWALEQAGLGPIVIVDRLRHADKWRNLAKRELMDIIEPDDLNEFLNVHASVITAIIHMGAISATTETDVDLIMDSNFRLSMDLWNWCTTHHVRFIYASSAATYGDGADGFVDDESCDGLSAFRPLNPYGCSKQLFDRRVARIIANEEPHPPQWAGLKFFNVYGPNEYHKGRMSSVVSQVYKTIKAGEPAVLFRSHRPDFEDGGQLRDFVWIGDCVAIIMWLLDNDSVSGLFNCGTGKARSFADLARAVYTALGKEPNIEFVDTPEDIRDKYQYFTEAKMDKIRQAGYNGNATSLEDGVADYVQNFLDADDIYQ